MNIRKNREIGHGLLLHGNPGTAKSAIACVIIMEALKNNYTVYYITVDQYIKIIAQKDVDSELQFCVEYSDFLLLEDVGREYRDAKGYIDSRVNELIRNRSDALLPTIITTNAISEKHFSMNDRRLESIIKEHYHPIKFEGKDYRNKIARKIRHEYQQDETHNQKTKKTEQAGASLQQVEDHLP